MRPSARTTSISPEPRTPSLNKTERSSRLQFQLQTLNCERPPSSSQAPRGVHPPGRRPPGFPPTTPAHSGPDVLARLPCSPRPREEPCARRSRPRVHPVLGRHQPGDFKLLPAESGAGGKVSCNPGPPFDSAVMSLSPPHWPHPQPLAELTCSTPDTQQETTRGSVLAPGHPAPAARPSGPSSPSPPPGDAPTPGVPGRVSRDPHSHTSASPPRLQQGNRGTQLGAHGGRAAPRRLPLQTRLPGRGRSPVGTNDDGAGTCRPRQVQARLGWEPRLTGLCGTGPRAPGSHSGLLSPWGRWAGPWALGVHAGSTDCAPLLRRALSSPLLSGVLRVRGHRPELCPGSACEAVWAPTRTCTHTHTSIHVHSWRPDTAAGDKGVIPTGQAGSLSQEGRRGGHV